MSTLNEQALQIIDNILQSLSRNSSGYENNNSISNDLRDRLMVKNDKESMKCEINMLCNWMKSQIDEYQANMNKLIENINTENTMELNESKHCDEHNNINNLQQIFVSNINSAKLIFERSLKQCDLSKNMESEYKYIAKWSSDYKGRDMMISDDSQTVTLKKKPFKSIRFEYGISVGMIVEINYLLHCKRLTGNFIGVVSCKSEQFHYNKRAMDDNGILDCYGIDTCSNRIYLGSNYRFIETDWNHQKQEIKFNHQQNSIITMIVDFSNKHNVLLSFYFHHDDDGTNAMHHDVADYIIKLPDILEDDEWYPAISLSRTNSFCKILKTELSCNE